MTASLAMAASHREAPYTALDRPIDITDFYAFRSPEAPDTVTFIMNVDPFQEPSNGPNYATWDPYALYEIRIDNNNDALEDLTFRFNFYRRIRLPDVFTGFIGAGAGINHPANAPTDAQGNQPTGLLIPPAITALTGAGSLGINLRDRYTASLIRGRGANAQLTSLSANRAPMYAVPSNVGPRTMPNYQRLYNQGVRQTNVAGVKVWVGTADDPFFIDLGAAFDTLNFRADAFPSGVAGVLTDEQDANDGQNFAPDDVSGYNVNVIAVQVPIRLLTRTGTQVGAANPAATIGAWGVTLRPRQRELAENPADEAEFRSNDMVQVARMANPLINELIIGTGFKDLWNRQPPSRDSQFARFPLDPLLARAFNAIYGIEVPDAPRTDLLPLVQYLPPIAAPGTPAGPVADLLRLNTGVPVTPAAQRSRLGAIGGDLGGFPNGRRLQDDVTDIASRVVAGVLAGAPYNGFPHNRIGDGVNTNERPFLERFPYVAPANSGRNSRHIDPGEVGCANGPCPRN